MGGGPKVQSAVSEVPPEVMLGQQMQETALCARTAYRVQMSGYFRMLMACASDGHVKGGQLHTVLVGSFDQIARASFVGSFDQIARGSFVGSCDQIARDFPS